MKISSEKVKLLQNATKTSVIIQSYNIFEAKNLFWLVSSHDINQIILKNWKKNNLVISIYKKFFLEQKTKSLISFKKFCLQPKTRLKFGVKNLH